MSELFNDMIEGLRSAESYLRGEREGFVVHLATNNSRLANDKASESQTEEDKAESL